MAQMAKQLDLLDFSTAKDFEELKKILNENNRRLQDAYRAIHNDIFWKEFIFFSVSGKRWRIGPDPDTHHFVLQELTGLDWRNQSHWQTQHTFYGGEKASTV